MASIETQITAQQRQQQRERRWDKVDIRFSDDGAYQIIKERILCKVLSTRVYVTEAWAWSIAHHSPSFEVVNLPLTELRLEGNNGSALSEDDSKDTTHSQHTFREPSEYLTPAVTPNRSSDGEISGISFGFGNLLSVYGAAVCKSVWDHVKSEAQIQRWLPPQRKPLFTAFTHRTLHIPYG